MPAWTLKTTATKMLQNLSSNTAPRKRKDSIDIQVHMQRSCFVESAPCDRSKIAAPYTLPPKYEKEFPGGRPRPKPPKIRNTGDDENLTPGPDEKAKGTGLVDRNRRRYGMMYYPEAVRDELRRERTRSRSPRVKTQLTPSPTPSFNEDLVITSARKDETSFEPFSWFSAPSQSDDPSRFSFSTSDQLPSGRIISGESSGTAVSPKSWETFRVPSIPPSPVDSVLSTVSAAPRDPRLPPADYLLYKDMYDDAMIKMHGKLPAEWVAYTHRHRPVFKSSPTKNSSTPNST